MLRRRIPPADERGGVIVFVAFTLVILMVFAAFVMDIGAQYLERRQDVTAADAGVLAGANKLRMEIRMANKDTIGLEAVKMARLNIHDKPDPDTWIEMFADPRVNPSDPVCRDDSRNMAEYPPGFNFRPMLTDGLGRTYSTDCVHFNAAGTRLRIKLPLQAVPTGFARVIGIKVLHATAAAEAQVWGGRRGVPFGFHLEGAATDLLCATLDRNCTPPTNQAPRYVDSPHFGNTIVGTTRSCGTMRSNPPPSGTSAPQTDPTLGSRAANNIAVGIDHVVGVWPGNPAPRVRDDCGNAPAASPQPRLFPNHLYANSLDALSSEYPAAAISFMDGIGVGLAFGGTFTDGGPSRLKRYPAGWSWTRTLQKGGGHTVDDRPLWDYIRPNNFNIPAVCWRTSFDAIDPFDRDNTGPTVTHLRNCLRAWAGTPGSPPLFDIQTNASWRLPGTYDIQYTPRMALIPNVDQCPTFLNCQNYPAGPILAFENAFIQTLYTSTRANRYCPCTVYNPGMAPNADPAVPGSGSNDLSGTEMAGIAIFWVQNGMLPEPARSDLPDPGGKVELIR